MLQFLVSLNPSKHQIQRAILATEMKQEREPESRLGGHGCLQRLPGYRAAAGATPSWSLCSPGSHWSPVQVTPCHFLPASDAMTPIHVTWVCIYYDFAMSSAYTGHNFQLHQALSNSPGNKILPELIWWYSLPELIWSNWSFYLPHLVPILFFFP